MLTNGSQRMSSCCWNWIAKSSALNLFFFKQKLMRWERRMFNFVDTWYSYPRFNLHCFLFSLLQNRWVACLLWRSTLTSWIWRSWLTCLTRNWLRFLLILTRRPTASRLQVTLDWSTNKPAGCLTVFTEISVNVEKQRQEKHRQGLLGSWKFQFNSFKCSIE